MTLLAALHALGRMDAAAFRWVNIGCYWRPAADLTYWAASDMFLLGTLATAVVVYWVWRGWRRAVPIGIWAALAVTASSLLHNEWLKPFFHRARPFLVMPDVHLSAALRDLSTVSLSFPSTHSSSAAALAVVVAGLDRGLRFPALCFALLIGAGAVYSGGHYPLDVLAGYAFGLTIGWALHTVRSRWLTPLNRPDGRRRVAGIVAVLASAWLLASPAPAAPDAVPGTPAAHAAVAPIPVLCYHRFGHYPEHDPYFVTPEEFRHQLEIIRDEGFTPILAQDLDAGLTRGVTLPAKPLLITIDDGYRDVYTQALPMLDAFGFRATAFIYPSFIGSHHGMSVEQLQALQARGWEIGSHSQTHPKLTQRPRGMSDEVYARWLETELTGSRRQLQEWLHAPVTSLAYPYGLWDQTVAEAARTAGYQLMFTVEQGTLARDAPRYALNRILIMHGTRDSTFRYLLHDRPLPVTARDPELGVPIAGPLTRVTVVVAPPVRGRLRPEAMQALWGGTPMQVSYAPESGEVRMDLPKPWTRGANSVMLIARDRDGAHYKETWLVSVKPPVKNAGGMQ